MGLRSSVNLGSPQATRTRARSAERTMLQRGEVIHLDFESHGLPSLDDEDDKPFANRQRLTSESSISKQVRSHRRVSSDPFDTAGMEGITDGDSQDKEPVEVCHGLIEEEENALPTLARFPFAETNNKNCWSESPVDIFSVRGPDYLSSKKKVTAKRYLLNARGCDLFLADKPNCVKISK